ncbi:hypothetical protein AVEN_27183-1 [Araneus ventricosus]|uniref:Uncharacterized protein n=1 Tax=Araneus ventricosus TaxID=182803 RepID=A0A4Y2S6Y8_ARAVE|nr:hypothetical protein AVEN_253352-1 [Araneus ventricosus]GBN83984.1 hypothetical protein AVEN_27183-1 [Araneus ventricosus]
MSILEDARLILNGSYGDVVLSSASSTGVCTESFRKTQSVKGSVDSPMSRPVYGIIKFVPPLSTRLVLVLRNIVDEMLRRPIVLEPHFAELRLQTNFSPLTSSKTSSGSIR